MRGLVFGALLALSSAPQPPSTEAEHRACKELQTFLDAVPRLRSPHPVVTMDPDGKQIDCEETST